MQSSSRFGIVAAIAAVWAWAPAGVCGAGEVRFTQQPKAVREGGKVKISFAASAATDVEVAILAADGRVVRHLAAGMLGRSAPAPLKAGALTQELTWDGTDDAGKAARGGPFQVRVRIGSSARREKVLGWDAQLFGGYGAVKGLAVGPSGELFVLASAGGGMAVKVLDRNGKYLRTIAPYPAGTPAKRAGGVGQLDLAGGERVPILYDGHSGNIHPLTTGMRKQALLYHPKGHLVVAGGVGNYIVHGPPRHLLAVHPEGGAPDGVAFVGPQIRKARGFLGGAGEAYARCFDGLAASPDGQYVYLTTVVYSGAGLRERCHGVFRLKWTDEALGEPFLGAKAPGDDDGHFNDPQGLATDAKGNLYVCDRGNGRVMIFDADGKLRGKFAAEKPFQIAVHPTGGQIYLLSRGFGTQRRGRWDTTTTLRKLSAFRDGPPKELARLAGKTVEAMALDATGSPPRVWVAVARGWGQRMILAAVADRGSRLELGAAVNTGKGLANPGFLAADPPRKRVLVREMDVLVKHRPFRAVDLETGKITDLPIRAADLAVDADGNLHAMDGYGTNSLSRYDPAGKPLPFAPGGSHRIKCGTYRAYGPDKGLRGMCVSPAGDLYIIRSNNHNYGGVDGHGVEGTVDVFSADGKLKRRGVVDGLGRGDCGLGVDARGNIYVGSNVKPADAPLPAYLAGKAPAKGWVWWRQVRPEPWRYAYCNPYLYHLGAVLKFGPEGGKVYGFGGRPGVKKGQPRPEASPLASVKNAPPGAAVFRSGYLAREVRVAGLKWHRAGFGNIPPSDLNWGDPSCICYLTHLAVDPYGRVYMPNPFRFSVELLDAAGNQIARIGRYGNADDGRGGGRADGPEIAFAWPAHVAAGAGGDRLFVADPVNRRVVVVRLAWAGRGRCPIPQ